MTTEHEDATPRPRSTFVSAVAWVFIVLTGFSTLIAVLQNVMVNVMFPSEAFNAAVGASSGAQDIPWFATFVLGHMRLFVFGFLIMSTTALISSIGLLKRRNWARVLFIAILILGILWNVGGMVAMPFLFGSMPQVSPQAPSEFAAKFELMSKVMIGFNILLGVAISGVFAWIVIRLLSSDVRREFTAV